MEIYLVGGAVRDRLLELPVEERDWVVVGATPDELTALGYRPVGKDFPVFLHPETNEEYALARTERKSGHGYKGFQVHASPEVTLEEDLLRRDLTINAMARAEDGTLIDPYGGQDDLHDGLLRHVSPAFAEDPVRILRLARFAARFSRWGFKVAHGTNALMRKMVKDGEVDYLVPERVWAEFVKALKADRPAQFFKALHGCGALEKLFPEIEALYGDAESAHGKEQEAAATVFRQLDNVAEKLGRPEQRFAALARLLADTWHPEQAASAIESIAARCKTPNEYRELAVLIARHGSALDGAMQLSPAELLELLEKCDAFRRGERLLEALTVNAAMAGAAYPQKDYLQRCLDAASAVRADKLVKAGLKGPEIGARMKEERVTAIADITP